MNIKTIEELGCGIMGVIYSVKFNDKPYTLKLEKADPSEDYGNNSYARQIKFNDFVVKSKFKKHFLALKSDGWIYDCGLILPIPKRANVKKIKYHTNKNKYTTCYYLIYAPPLRKTLSEILAPLPYKSQCDVINDCMLQLLPVIAELHNCGYSHNDLHTGNIMYDKHWYVTDYGLVKHNSWKANTDDAHENIKSTYSDLYSLLMMCIYAPIMKMCFEKNVFKPNTFNDCIKNIKNSKDYHRIKKKLKDTPSNIIDDLIGIYCELYYFDTFREAFGAPKGIVIPESKLLISGKLFKQFIKKMKKRARH